MPSVHRPTRRAVAAGLAFTLVPLRSSAITPVSVPLTLRAAPAPRRLVPESTTEAELWSFGSETPPAIRIRHGSEFHVRLRNDTPLPLSLHWHGVRGPSGQDGVGGFSGPAVPPGSTSDWRFTPPDPGTFLIRPLVLGGSGEPAGRGLSGLLVVEEREPPAVDGDHALLVRDWRLEPSGALAPFGNVLEAALGGRLGGRLAVEGRDAPRRIEAPAGARLRLRLANGSNARAMRIRFDGLRATVGAIDGQPTDTFEPLRSTLPFPPGSRYDLFFDVPTEPGRVVALVGPGVPLLEVAPSAAPAVTRPPVAPLPPNTRLPPEIKLQNAVRKTIAITGGAIRGPGGQPVYEGDPRAIWRFNGAAGAPANPPLFTARRGQPVVLGFTNGTPFAQPLHLHGHALRLLHPLDDGWEPYWVDTFQVPEGKTVQTAFLADNPGRWLIGSSVLERLDAGLWGWFEVT